MLWTVCIAELFRIVHSFLNWINLLQGWLTVGNSQRATAATGMNEKSSRSHSIFSIILTKTEVNCMVITFVFPTTSNLQQSIQNINVKVTPHDVLYYCCIKTNSSWDSLHMDKMYCIGVNSVISVGSCCSKFFSNSHCHFKCIVLCFHCT